MSKKQEASAIEKVEPQPSQLTEIPDWLKQDAGQGLDHIGSKDVLMPRLALAQGLSPQLNPDKPEYLAEYLPGTGSM